jgi:predicted branched-subunit amino acid permease
MSGLILGQNMAAETVSEPTATSEFWLGVKAGLPVVLAAAPFGLLFGALAVENGLSVLEATLMSAAVFGGASQMVGIELFGQNVAPWLIVLSIFAVNFRHVLYSAAIGRRIGHWPVAKQAIAYFFLTDPQYAEAERKAEEEAGVGFVWYLGMALGIYVPWVVESWLGATFGGLIPDPHALGIDFLLPIYFLGLVMDFRDRPLWLPVVGVSAVVSIVAYHTVGSPWHVSIGAVAGILLAVVLPPHMSVGKRSAGK